MCLPLASLATWFCWKAKGGVLKLKRFKKGRAKRQFNKNRAISIFFSKFEIILERVVWQDAIGSSIAPSNKKKINFKEQTMFKHIKSDAVSGFLVFLIALPLCLGIAKASGFPPIAGIYTAVIGGLLVTFLTNSQLTIKGPAAGLIVIALGAVEELGQGNSTLGYQLTLAVVVVSGVFQVLLGLIKSGKLGDFFPSTVIHGMLAAIGVIIMSKQIHIAMGVVPVSKTPLDLIAEIPISFLKMNPEVALIGLVSILILFLHPFVKNKVVKRIPAPLLVLVVAIPLGFYFDLNHEHDYELGSLSYHMNPEQLLVALPDQFFSGITTPDFSQITSLISIKYIVMFALVGSIESILSAKAIDTLDPEFRKSNLNQDLVAVGVGNTVVGLIGGIPMISEIVRSSANINNGGKTKMSNFFHGLFLFLFVLLAAPLIQTIPNAALSAMLVYIGFKLASPAEFKKVKNLGYDQLLLFVVTIVVTILTDLLIGVGVGILLKIILHLTQGVSLKDLVGFRWASVQRDGQEQFLLKGATTFMNYLKFKSFIEDKPKDSVLTFDFGNVKLADHTFMENLHHLQNDFVQAGGKLNVVGFEHHHFQSKHPLSSRRLVLNPLGSRNEALMSKRQTLFKEIATEFGFEFTSNDNSAMMRPYLSPFAILSVFRRTKKMIIDTEPKYNLLLCDIEYQKVDDFKITLSNNVGTIAVLNNLPINQDLPEFYLERESLLFDLQSRYNFQKISLKHKTPFSVYGNDTLAVQSFFGEEMIAILAHCPYVIESRRRSILIHHNFDKIGDKKQLVQFTNFCTELAEFLSK